LSAYLDRAEKGETIVVTQHGKPKVQIIAIPQEEDPIERGIREGWITPGVNFRSGKPRPQVRGMRSKPGVRLMDIIDEDRGD
jgi:antitoxin (DNA-binding transcriptional repressor) of toxin-antitoxin stability system